MTMMDDINAKLKEFHLMFPNEIGRSYADGCLDVTGAGRVEVQTSKKVLWVNVDGVCLLRICRIKVLLVDGERS